MKLMTLECIFGRRKVFHLTDTEYEKFIYQQLNAQYSSEFLKNVFKAISRSQRDICIFSTSTLYLKGGFWGNRWRNMKENKTAGF